MPPSSREAGRRAQQWLSQQGAKTPRAWALDEQYSSQRGKAYQSAHRCSQWTSLGHRAPVAVDGESWTLVWWYLHEQGLVCERSVSDGGRAIQEALDRVQRLDRHQRDVWHVLHTAAQVQGRLDRSLQQCRDRLPVIQRQAARVAQGKKARGRAPVSNVTEHEQHIQRATYATEALRYLLQELHTLRDVVVLASHRQAGVLSSTARQLEVEAVLQLLEELSEQTLSSLQKDLQSLAKQRAFGASSSAAVCGGPRCASAARL